MIISVDDIEMVTKFYMRKYNKQIFAVFYV